MYKSNKPKKAVNVSASKPVRNFSSGDVFIGNKDFMNYVTSAIMLLNSGSKRVSIRARGKYISKAVDVAEVVRNRFVRDAKLSEIKVASEEFTGESGKRVRVSIIELVLTK